MTLRRRSSIHRFGGTDSQLFWDFKPGQRVMTPEGIPGTVAAVEDGFVAGAEQYIVELDGGLGGGEYAPSELTALRENDFDEFGYLSSFQKRANSELGSGGYEDAMAPPPDFAINDDLGDMAEDDELLSVASNDYPELSDILVERPPLSPSERVAYIRRLGADWTTQLCLCGHDRNSHSGTPLYHPFDDDAGWAGICFKCECEEFTPYREGRLKEADHDPFDEPHTIASEGRFILDSDSEVWLQEADAMFGLVGRIDFMEGVANPAFFDGDGYLLAWGQPIRSLDPQEVLRSFIEQYRERTSRRTSNLEEAVEDLATEMDENDHSHAGLIIKALDTGRVLMTQRTLYYEDDEDVQGKWEFPGGGVNDDEEAVEAAIREFQEETGLTLPEGWQLAGAYTGGSWLGVLITVPYEAWTTDVELLEGETEGIGWFTPEEADILFRADVEPEWDTIKEASAGWEERRYNWVYHNDNGTGEVDEGLSVEGSPGYSVKWWAARYDEDFYLEDSVSGIADSMEEAKSLVERHLASRTPVPVNIRRQADGWFTDQMIDKVLYPLAENFDSKMPPYLQYDPQTGAMPSHDICRWRYRRQCYFPSDLNERATEEAGYNVWVPNNRGLCPRETWGDQRACPMFEPGPNAGPPERPLAWGYIPWEQGGQRYDSAGRPITPPGWER